MIAFGDVSGKGAAAALYGGLLSGLLRTLAPRRRRPAELLRALNEALIERKVEARYVTLFVLLWDPAHAQIVMANAGAMPPMICRGSDILEDASGRRAAGTAGRARVRRGRPSRRNRTTTSCCIRTASPTTSMPADMNSAAAGWRTW